MKIITISREFGSGGRELGKRLAEELGIHCYDHEIIELIAKEHGFDERYVANISEKCIEAAYPMTIGHRFAMPPVQIMDQGFQVAAAQQQIIENFAKQGDCVIVGRCADYVLRGVPNVLRVYIHAPLEDCSRRVSEMNSIPLEAARRLVQITDKRRAAYYAYFTGSSWKNADNYDLCLDSSSFGHEKCVQMIREYLKIKLSVL